MNEFKLKPSAFKWNRTVSNLSENENRTQWGLIADDTKVIYPDMESGKVEWSKILMDLVASVKFSIIKIKQLDNQKLDKTGDDASINRLIVQDVFRIPKYAKLPDIYPVGGQAYNTTDNTLNIMKPDGWYIVQTAKR